MRAAYPVHEIDPSRVASGDVNISNGRRVGSPISRRAHSLLATFLPHSSPRPRPCAMGLRVTLPTSPPQVLQGFTTTAPVTAHSSPSHPTVLGADSASLSPVHKWLGIPFGTAERFAPPTPFVAQPGAGVRECFEFGPTPLQPLGAMEPFWLKKEGWLDRDFVGDGENCLSLNVYAPAMASEELTSLPVMVRPPPVPPTYRKNGADTSCDYNRSGSMAEL